MRLVEGLTQQVLTHVQSTAPFDLIVRARLHDPTLLDEEIDTLQTMLYHPDGRLKIVDSDIGSWRVLLRISEPQIDGTMKIPLAAYDRVPARLEVHGDALEGIIGKHITEKRGIVDHIILRALLPDTAAREEFAQQIQTHQGTEPFGVHLSKKRHYAYFRKISLGSIDQSSSIYCYNGCYHLTVLER